MPPPRPATEARSGSLEPGRPNRARSANTRHPAGRPHTPPADRMYATDVRCQTDRRQTASSLNAPPGGGITSEYQLLQANIAHDVSVSVYICVVKRQSAKNTAVG